MDTLCKLKPLLPGLSPLALSTLSWPELGDASLCQCWSLVLAELRPAQRGILYNTLQQALDRTLSNATLHLHCLLPYVPLRKLMSEIDGAAVLKDLPLYTHLPWSPQQ
ncbi:hypothetical protein JZ751_020736, partial [Albula glossodonta]